MIHSMTAFSTDEMREDGFIVGWEVRTVNHRYLDVFLKLPEQFRFLDPEVRTVIGQTLKRGKVDCIFFYRQVDGKEGDIRINTAYARKLLAAVEEMEGLMVVSKTFSALDAMNWPGVLQESDIDLENAAASAMASLQNALEQLVLVRQREGQELARLVSERCKKLEQLVAKVRARRSEAQEAVRLKIERRLAELMVEIDQQRLEQELVYLVQKMDVAEELDRLEAHVREVLRLLEEAEPVGRRMDFLMQEMNREANTLTSKSADLETTQCAVEMKVLIEQMREQIQNIE